MFTYKLLKNDEISTFSYIPNLFNENDLSEIVHFIQNINFITGLSYNGTQIRRKQIWFQENQEYFCEKWKGRFARWMGHKYVPLLYKIQDQIKKYIDKDVLLNSCLINKYENGNDIIGAHRDSIDSFGETPTIANVSLGASRTMRIRDVDTKEIVLDISLENNSLFIMTGASQKYYTHEIIKDDNIMDCRYSMTFREKIRT